MDGDEYDEFDQTEQTGSGRSGQRSGQRSKQKPKQSGPRKPKSWVPVDEHGEPVEMTEDQVVKLRERAANLCVWYLGRGPKTRKELLVLMGKKEVPSDMAESILDQLSDYNYVNDEEFATNFVQAKHFNQRKGASVVRHELRQKGVDDETAAAALEQITEESQQEAAEYLVARKMRSTVGLDHNKRVNRLVGMLARKGYSPGLAYQVVREAIANEGVEDTDLLDQNAPDDI